MFRKCSFFPRNIRKVSNVSISSVFIHLPSAPEHKLLVPVFMERQSRVFFSQAMENAETTHYYSNKIKSFGPVIRDSSKRALFRQYLLKNSQEYPTLFIPGALSLNSSSRALDFLKEFKTNELNDSDSLLELKNILTNELSSLDTKDVREILHAFALTPFKSDRARFMEVVTVLNDDCMKRMKSWTIDDHLMQMDSLHPSRSFLYFNYVWKRMAKYCLKLPSLTPKQIVHTLYLLSFFSKFPYRELKFTFQDNLNRFVPHLNLTELALMNFTFCHLNLKLSHPTLLHNIISKLLDEELNNVEMWTIDFFFEAALKLGTFASLSNITELQGRLIPFLDKINADQATSAVSCGLRANMINEDLLKRVLEKAKGDIDACSSSSLVRLIYLCAKFNIYDDELIRMATDQIKKRDNVGAMELVTFVKLLVHMNVLDGELMKRALSKEIVDSLLKRPNRVPKVDLLLLENTVRLEMPNYDGPLLEEEVKIVLWREHKCFKFKEKQNNLLQNLDRIYGHLQSKIELEFQGKKCAWKKILMGYPAMLVLRFDENLNLTPVPDEFIELKGIHDFVEPPRDGFTWAVVVAVTSFTLGLDGEVDRFTSTRIRHIEKVGYNVLQLERGELNYSYLKNEFRKYFESEVEKQLGKKRATS